MNAKFEQEKKIIILFENAILKKLKQSKKYANSEDEYSAYSMIYDFIEKEGERQIKNL